MTLPIACNLSADATRAGREGPLPRLAERAVTRAATADGYVLTFAAGSENLLAIRRTIDAERQRGRWLTFSVVVEPDGGPITLTLTGPREFLAGLMDA